MNEASNRKYKRVMEILPDVAECAGGRLVLAGGTALALFYLQHRVSVDLDFVALEGDETTLKQKLKGCVSKRGYRTVAGAYANQFIINFEDTGIKVEVFSPETRINRFEERVFGNVKIRVAKLRDLERMKVEAYQNRREARDLFDIFCITGRKAGVVKKLVAKAGPPKNVLEVEGMVSNKSDFVEFVKAIPHDSKTGD